MFLKYLYIKTFVIYIHIIIIGIQPLGRSRQRPELSQATGMALVRCILGKFLGVVCHCFPPTYIYIKISYLTIKSNLLQNFRFHVTLNFGGLE